MRPAGLPSYARRQKTKRRVLILLVVACVLVVGWWALSRPTTTPATHVSFGTLAWPAYGQSAVGIVGNTIVETHGTQTPVPTASTAKMITALVVLQAKPLSLGQTGPALTMTRDDIALLIKYDSLGGSEIGKVFVGEQLTEYQMLESMMLPSANNMADSLAIWAYGSLPAYRVAANKYLASLGLKDTHVGTDASGLDPSTVSTAHDMVVIGEQVMQNPVLAEIVGKKSSSNFPLIGTITNTNRLLGQHGVVGIKTGNSDDQGGAFVGAANSTVNGRPQTVVTAVLGASALNDALSDSLSLVQSIEANYQPVATRADDNLPQQHDLCGGTGGNGQVASVGNSSFTLTQNNGSNRIVYLTPQATIKTSTGLISVSDLRAGDRVTLVGGPNPDGSFTAEAVFVCADAGTVQPVTARGGNSDAKEVSATIDLLTTLLFGLIWLGIVVVLWVKKKSLVYLLFFTIFYIYLYKVLDYTLFQFQSLLILERFVPGLMLNGIPAGKTVNLVPLLTLTLEDLKTSLLNILMMMPFGFGLPFITKLRMRQVVVWGVLFSVGIELLQFITGFVADSTFRVADINDVIFNTVGVAVGYVLFVMFIRIYRSLFRNWRNPISRYITERPQVK